VSFPAALAVRIKIASILLVLSLCVDGVEAGKLSRLHPQFYHTVPGCAFLGPIMNERRRILLLSLVIMTSVAVVVAVISMAVLYRAALEQQRARLVETVQSRAHLIEAIAQFDIAHSATDVAGGAEAATLSQVVHAHEQFSGFGQTGEFTLARREGDQIVFLLRHRHSDLDNPRPVPIDSELAEPMRRALSGISGTVVGLDYRGERVLAAHEFVDTVNWGVVGKIDLAEIRRVFLRAGAVVLVVGLVVIAAGAVLFLRSTGPLIRRLETSEASTRAILKTAGDAIITINEQGVIESFNSAAERIFGHAASDVLGQNVGILMPSPHRENHNDYLARYLHTGEAKVIGSTLAVAGQRADGTIIPLEASVSEVSLRGQRIFTGVLRDVTERERAEKRLRTAEHRYRTLFEQSPDAVVVIEPETTLPIEFNELAPRLLGYSPEEFSNLPISDYEALESPERTKAHVEEALRAGGDDFETKWRTKQGRIIDVSVRIRVLEISGRRVFHNIFRDITEAKRTEELLRRDEARLEAMVKLNDMAAAPFEQVADFALEQAISLTRSRMGFLGFLNADESVMTIHAWSEAAMRECEILDKATEFEVAKAGLWGEVIRQRQAIVVNDYSGLDMWKQGYPEGHVALTRFLGVPIFDGESIVAVAAMTNKEDQYDDVDLKQLTLLIGGLWRIVQRQRAEDALRDSRAFLQTVIDGIPESLLVIDRDHRVVLANRTARKTSDLSSDTRDAHMCYRVSHGRDTPCGEAGYNCPLEEIVRAKVPVTVTHAHKDREGNEVVMELVAAPIFDKSGEVIQIIESCRDVTERKRLEKEILETGQQERQRIGQDLHDAMGQHLTGAAFHAKALQQRLAGQASPEADSALRIANMINESITQARALAKGLCPIELSADGLMSALQQHASDVEVLFGVKCSYKCDEPVLIDDSSVAVHLYRIAQEAINNAVKHGRAQRIEIELARKNERSVLRIRDDGGGIPDKLDEAGGMGLRIMGYRARMIGAGISASRHPDGGTIVECWL